MKRLLTGVVLLVLGGLVWAGPMEEGLALMAQGKYEEALTAFDRELKVRPANTQAYIYAGTAAEKIPDLVRAARYWESLLKITADETEQKLAETRLAECRKPPSTVTPKTEKPDKTDKPKTEKVPAKPSSPFDTVEDQFIKVESEHFLVMAKNRALAQKAAEEGERHLKRICEAFVRGQIWPRKVSVYIFKDQKEYVTERGLPDWSGGGYSYMPYSADNTVRRVDLFQLGRDGKYQQNLLSQTLAHELTHVVMEEWFGNGARNLPRALNEGLAMYVEEGTHEDYEKLAAQATGAGLYFHFKDLFAFRNYPPQVGVFYMQSASATRYLIEHLTADQFNAMMDGIKKGEDMNTALCSATGRVGDLLGSVEANWVAWKKEEAAKLPKLDIKKHESEKGPIKETQQK